MNSASSVILCLAYIIGLLSTAVGWGKYVMLAMGIVSAIAIPRFWKTGPKFKLWLVAGIIGLMAALYFQIRVPQPALTDISKLIPSQEEQGREKVVTVEGKIFSTPRLTRSGRSQFWLETSLLKDIQGSSAESADVSKKVTGKLYVTVPLLQATGLYPGKEIAVTGLLYEPKPATNPGGFNFKAYLAQEGIFAGLKGRQVTVPDELQVTWGWWAIRQRIIRSQVKGLGIPEGPLISAMVLGNRVVDLPFYLSDSFIRTGLAHALAASGFQVSLILGVILALTARFPVGVQFGCALTGILIFVGLAGPQASVLRAVVMGIGGLIGLLQKREVKPLGSLLVAATILLFLNPLWIWDLGFQLSFLATLGLVTTAAPLAKKLDWMPPAIAGVIAVPIASSLWTIPIQLYAFGLISPYSILANIITILPLSLISIGAFISGLAGVIIPDLGSFLAWLLYYPTQLLIIIVEFFSQLPGNSVAIGKISIVQLITLYGLIALVWLQSWWRKRWWIAIIIATVMLIVPIWQTKTNLFQLTVLSTSGEPVLVIQDKGKVTLVNTGDETTTRFTVLPFLQQQGINQIDWAVATNTSFKNESGWEQIGKRINIINLYMNRKPDLKAIKFKTNNLQDLAVGKNLLMGSTLIKLINANPLILQLRIQGKNWLMLGNVPSAEANKLRVELLPRAEVLWWAGDLLKLEVLAAVQPSFAIASSASINPDMLENLNKNETKVYWTGRDGALQWTPGRDFDTTLEAPERDASVL